MRISIAVAAIVLLTLAGVGFYFASSRERQEADARKKLAFVSLTERLPKGKPITPVKGLNAVSQRRWELLDRNLASYQDPRAKLLKALHEKTRRFFVASPGAGSERQIFTPEMILMDDYWHFDKEPNQPGEPADFPTSHGEALARVDPDDEFHLHHQGAMQSFLFPTGFGYVKDRAHVAGFKPHGFRYFGGNPVHESERWRIQHIELIGILSHQAPVVYLTDKLPSMEQIRQGKTRPLDFFEEAAFPSLREGEDLYIVRKAETLRMVGALRATKACLQCHDAKVGDLLGAFSYTLRLGQGGKPPEKH